MEVTKGARNIAWADVTKAVCVCLVVLMHSEGQIAAAGWFEPSRTTAVWHEINELLRPIRMPSFFMVSGLLAAGSIMDRRPHALRKGLLKPMYLYVVWAFILILLIPDPAIIPAHETIFQRLTKVFLLGSPAWYLYALGLFYLLAKATREVPATALLIACAGISLLGAIFVPGNVTYAPKLLRCLVFFMAGVRIKGAIVGFAEATSPARTAILFVLYVAAAALTAKCDTYLLPIDILAVAFTLSAMSLLSLHLGALAAPIQWVGRRTLFVYLMHFPLIYLVSGATRRWAPPEVLGNAWLGFLYPVVSTMAVVPAALALGALLQRMGLPLLFDLPSSRRDDSGQALVNEVGNTAAHAVRP